MIATKKTIAIANGTIELYTSDPQNTFRGIEEVL